MVKMMHGRVNAPAVVLPARRLETSRNLNPVAPNAFVHRRVILFAATSILLGGVLLLVVYAVQAAAIRAHATDMVSRRLEITAKSIESDLAQSASDLAFLSTHPLLRQFVESQGAIPTPLLADEYLAFARQNAKYDQIRLLNPAGRELVRVNQNDGAPTIVSDTALQEKGWRYYVAGILNTPPGDNYVSALDLNVDNGAIEVPAKPILRLGRPIHDSAGNLRGAVVLNFLGARLIRIVEDARRDLPGEVWLVNQNGYWLAGPSPAVEWAFMYPDRQDRLFSTQFPEAWEAALTNSHATLQQGGDAFVVERVQPGSAPQWPTWSLVGFIPKSALSVPLGNLRRNILIAFGLLVLSSAASARYMAFQDQRRRDAHARRVAAEQALRASESRLASLLEAVPDGVVVVDSEGRIDWVSDHTMTLFQYRREELVGQKVELLLPDRLRTDHINYRDTYARAPRPRNMGENLDLFGRRKDGTEFPIAVSLSPVEIDDGQRVIASVRDITMQRQHEKRIVELNARLERDNNELTTVNKELEAFSAAVSHDLRSPLRSIDGFSDALLEDHAHQLDDAGLGYLKRIRGGAQRMGFLIDDLLKLSRLSRADLSEDEVDISALARQIAAELTEAEPKRDVEFEIANDLRTRADRRLLGIVLQNLIGNAFKFTRDRTPGRIEIGAETRDGAVVYHVRDNGAGFDMAYADQLFGAFKRLHDAREFPGNGVGLATAQRVIHKHGGRIWAQAKVGEGAVFYFTLRRSEVK